MTPVLALLAFLNLFAEFGAATWDAWRAVLAQLTPDVREFYAICGRGSGKSRIVAMLACNFASREYPRVPGESIFVGVFAPDRKQAGVTFRYVVGLLRSVPELAALIVNETRDAIELSNGIIIEVLTASTAAPRGRAYALAIVEEASFLPTDDGSNPDVELLRALRPALARVPGSLLAVIGSPYARRGVMYTAVQRNAKQPDPHVLVVQKPTLELNPAFDATAIERAYAEDPLSAAAEYGAQFRSDVAALFASEAIGACVQPGRHELPPMQNVKYVAFTDPSGGSADAFTLAIAHVENRQGHDVRVLDAVREVLPPFSPEATVAEFAGLLRSYRVASVTGDRYGGEWPREVFRRHGITYTLSDASKSDIYLATLPLINSRRIELLDHSRLVSQLMGLERRTARGGRDSIDHAPGGHDDVANAAAGALEQAGASTAQAMSVVWLRGFGR